MSDAAHAYEDGVSYRPSEIDVAVKYLGGRADKLMRPLDASSLNVVVDPQRPQDFDVVMLDQPRYNLAKEVVLNNNTPVVYRVRGNIWKEMDIWRFGRTKKFVAENFIYPQLDGAIAVTDRLATIFSTKTGVNPVGSAGLSKDLTEWADATHETEELELITLTNFNYKQKVDPMLEYFPVVDGWLDENGGTWHLCGEGIHADRFNKVAEKYDNIIFEGYIDPHEWLPQMDAVIHISNFDAYPNAILEGFASNLPVLTNSFVAFQREHAPNITHTTPHSLVNTLIKLTNSAYRSELGNQGKQYIREYHTASHIGKQYADYFAQVIYDSD